MSLLVRLLTATFILLTFCASVSTTAFAAEHNRVLVYTRNYTPDGKGYVHDNLAASVEAIRKLGQENGFEVDHSDDPAVFTAENLAKYDVIVFSSSNNEAFATDAQRGAFQTFLRSGKGFVGIHSATGSERKWPWFWEMIGGSFKYHPPMQAFEVEVVGPAHPATTSLPFRFLVEDECYFHQNMNTHITPLLVADVSYLRGVRNPDGPQSPFGRRIPLAWFHRFEGARVFHTALGHKKEHYKDPRMLQQILGGIEWAMGKAEAVPR